MSARPTARPFRPRSVLSIAGSDPSGGAGIQADIKTIVTHGLYAEAVSAVLTAQSTTGVTAVRALDPLFVRQQIEAVLDDGMPNAIKVGMLGDARTVHAVAVALDGVTSPIVLDPVMLSSSGAPLLAPDAISVLVEDLMPHVTLVTPNIPEAERLTGLELRAAGSWGAPSLSRAATRRARRPTAWPRGTHAACGSSRSASPEGEPMARAARSRRRSPAASRAGTRSSGRCATPRPTSPERSPTPYPSGTGRPPSTTYGAAQDGREANGQKVSPSPSPAAAWAPTRGRAGPSWSPCSPPKALPNWDQSDRDPPAPGAGPPWQTRGACQRRTPRGCSRRAA